MSAGLAQSSKRETSYGTVETAILEKVEAEAKTLPISKWSCPEKEFSHNGAARFPNQFHTVIEGEQVSVQKYTYYEETRFRVCAGSAVIEGNKPAAIFKLLAEKAEARVGEIKNELQEFVATLPGRVGEKLPLTQLKMGMTRLDDQYGRDYRLVQGHQLPGVTYRGTFDSVDIQITKESKGQAFGKELAVFSLVAVRQEGVCRVASFASGERVQELFLKAS